MSFIGKLFGGGKKQSTPKPAPVAASTSTRPQRKRSGVRCRARVKQCSIKRQRSSFNLLGWLDDY
jgi:hypothetical protein